MTSLRSLLLVMLLVLAGCTGDPSTGGAASGAGTPTASPTRAEAAEPRRAEPAPRPEPGRCYRLTYAGAVAPTTDRDPVPCRRDHTSYTFHVGTIDAVVDGHLLAVDSERVREQLAEECPRRFAAFSGATEEALRLSLLRPVWFSPTLEASDAGQDWFRCDVIAVATSERLALLGPDLRGVLGTEAGRERYGICGTARPGDPDFRRVICARPHSWRAVASYDVPAGPGGGFPGSGPARAQGESRCQDVVRERAEDPLSFTWGFEAPTQEQWAAGRRHGLCWMPD